MVYVKKRDRPAEGGAIGGGESDAVREPIREMLAGGSEEDFKSSLPSQTSTGDAGVADFPANAPRKRRTKAEIAAEKGPATPVDKRLERAKAKCSGLGAAALVEQGAKLAGEPLNDQETEDVGDQFYLISVKAGIDPMGSWPFVIIYTIVLLIRLALARTELGEQIKKVFEDFFKEKETGTEGALKQ